jgi:hypothetical protein
VLRALQTRIPDKRNIVTVFAVAMFLVYTWTLFTSFWKLPSWLFFLQVGEILSIYAYAFVVNFIESILLLLVVLLPALLLPRRWWTDAFIPRGFALILIVLSSAVLRISLYRTPDTRAAFISGQLIWWVVTLLLAILLTWIAGSVEWVRRGLENMADRFVVFLYIYLPLTAIAFLIVAARIFL